MKTKKRKIPKFLRQEWFRQSRLGKKWRKPKGLKPKMKIGKAGKPAMVRIGWRSPKSIRYLHPSGLKEKLVNNVGELKGADKSFAVRIASGVGKKKRIEIRKKAKESGIKLLN